MRAFFVCLAILLSMPTLALAQGAVPPPPPEPANSAAPATVAGPWTSFVSEGGVPAAGLGTTGASLAFMCFPDVGYALLYRASVSFPDSVQQAKSVHILFGELRDPKTGKGGSIIEGVVDPPVDPHSLLISGEGIDKMIGLAESAALDLRMAVVDGETVIQADNFSSKGSTAAIKQFKQACGPG